MRNLWLGLVTIETGDKFAHFYRFILLFVYFIKSIRIQMGSREHKLKIVGGCQMIDI